MFRSFLFDIYAHRLALVFFGPWAMFRFVEAQSLAESFRGDSEWRPSRRPSKNGQFCIQRTSGGADRAGSVQDSASCL